MNTEHIASTIQNPGRQRRFYKDEVESLIDTQLIALNGGLLEVLSRCETNEAVRTWQGTVPAIEEFINFPLFGVRDSFMRTA